MERNASLLNQTARLLAKPDRIDCETAFRCIVKGCIHTMQRCRTAAADGDADAVHKMRIELTRFRAVLLFFSPILTKAGWRRTRRYARWLNSRLGQARDQDVLLQYARRRRYRRWARTSFRPIERERTKSYRKLAVDLHSARYHRLMHDIDRQTHQPQVSSEGPQSGDVGMFSEARLLEWRDEIERTGRHLQQLGRTRQHRLRLKCKRYRYVVDSLLKLGVGLSLQDLEFRETAKQAHATLGDLRDLRRFKCAGDGRPPRYRAKKRKLLERAESAFRRHG
nr:CHAD domain-containing protein [Bradyrhizobium sp. CCGUVB23]